MNTSSRTDWQLLRRYVDDRSQEAFAALVARHLDMVYTTCLREIGNASQAEDATQAVFISLAVKAPRLSSRTHVAGWLFQAARFAARTIQTRETRRKRYEFEAASVNAGNPADEREAWREIEPLLTDAVAKLTSSDREAILLRYFDGLRPAEVGASLGISEQAARKRVTRAVERLRRYFERRGIADFGAASLAGLLPLHAAKAAPPALAPMIAHYAKGGAGAKSVSLGLLHPTIFRLSQGTLNAMRIAQLKAAVGIAAAAFVVGGAAFGAAHVKPKLSTPTMPPQPSASRPLPVAAGFDLRDGAVRPDLDKAWHKLPRIEQAKLTASEENAKLLGLAIVMYLQDHHEMLPPMASAGAAKSAVLSYVKTDPGYRQLAADSSLRANSRLSAANFATMANVNHTIMFYSAAPDAFGYRTVLFGDGHENIVGLTEWTMVQADLSPR